MNYPFFTPAHLQPYQFFSMTSNSNSNTNTNANTNTNTPRPDPPLDSTIHSSTFDYDDYTSAFNNSFFSPNDTPSLGAHQPPPPPPQPQPQQSPQRNNSASNSRPQSMSIHQSIDMVRDDLAQYIFSDFVEEPHIDKRSSSEEDKDNTTPAQSRRKAQNRAAQRAFRERKERHVRELEKKLTDLQAQSMTLHADNERLKRELAKIVTENEILRATGISSMTGSGDGDDGRQSSSSPRQGELDEENTHTAPPKFQPKDGRKFMADAHKTGSLPHRIMRSSDSGERLLNARAAWDLIQAHPLYAQGLIDIGDVCERLKSATRCDGQGPVFEEGRVRAAIEESAACGNDELI